MSGKDEIVRLLIGGDQTIDSIVADGVVPFCKTAEDFQKFLFSIAEIGEFTKQPLIKIRFYLFQVLLIYRIVEISEKPDPIEKEYFDQILLYFRLALPICSSISDTSMDDFILKVEEYYNEKYPETIRIIEEELGFVKSERNDVQSAPAKKIERKHYSDPLPKKDNEHKRCALRHDSGALMHTLSHDKNHGIAPNISMVRIRIKKTHSTQKKKGSH